MAHSRLQIALPSITHYFENLETTIFSYNDIVFHVMNNRHEWNLAKSTSIKGFLKFLLKNSKLLQLEFPFPYRSEVRFVWGKYSIFEVLLTLKNKSYFSHHTALYLHGLTSTPPGTIYLNHEQAIRPQSVYIEQKSIDAAFRNRARQSNNVIDFDGTKVCMINGKNTNELGVINQVISDKGLKVEVRLTDLERTLIDITVRPVYSGGVHSVQRAFELAKGRISIDKLISTLSKLKHLYPYHQSIGYYLERAGYDLKAIQSFEKMPMEFDFYLMNQIKSPIYNSKWKLYVPEN